MNKNIKDIQSKCLQILDKFIDVCKEYKLAWFADCGTLLGAVRKNKMIDWDNDIDIIMPRKDYNKLLEIGEKAFTAPYFFQTPKTDNVWCLHPRIRLDNTTAIMDFEQGGKHHQGIFIDIFCLDTISENEDEILKETNFIRTLVKDGHLHSVRFNDERNICILNKSASFDILNNIVETIGLINNKSKYVANALLFRCKGCEKVKFLKSDYEKYFLIDFEGLKNKLRIPCGYTNILKQWYGNDWMIEKKINSGHEITLYDTNNSYLKYIDLSYDEYIKLV